MKKKYDVFKRIIILMVVFVNISSVCFAAWWGTPGYEWCFSKGLTTIMTQKEMSKIVEQEDFYAILLRYLKYKGVRKYQELTKVTGNTGRMNAAIVGLMLNVDKYISEEKLSPNQYKQVKTYIEHAERTAETHKKLFTREELKSFYMYMALAKYRSAMLLTDWEYREKELSSLKYVKNSEIITYGIAPYYGDITRQEFLVLMFELLMPKKEDGKNEKIDVEKVIKRYIDGGVLVGYDQDRMLNKELTYSELFTFLHRFEFFEFTLETKQNEE